MAPDFHITPIIREGRAVDFNVIRTGSSLPFAPAAGDLLRTGEPFKVAAASPEAFHNTNDHLTDALCSEGSGFGHDRMNSSSSGHSSAGQFGISSTGDAR